MASVLPAVRYTSVEVYTGVYAEYTTCALYSVTSSSWYIHVYIYRIAGIFRGRKLSRIGVKEDFAEKTFAQGTPRATCMRGCGLNLSPHPQ